MTQPEPDDQGPADEEAGRRGRVRAAPGVRRLRRARGGPAAAGVRALRRCPRRMTPALLAVLDPRLTRTPDGPPSTSALGALRHGVGGGFPAEVDGGTSGRH